MRGPIRSILLAAFAAVGCMLAVGASSAMAVNILTAAGGITTGALRDDLTVTAPATNAQYGTDILAQNTKGALALTTGEPAEVQNQNGQFYAFVGLKLHSNPEAKNCSVATAYAEFVDLQKATHLTASSPVYADTLIDPWRVDINSDMCAVNPGVVRIGGVGLFFPTLGIEARGTIEGVYVQPGATSNCTAGGVQFNLKQPNLLLNGVATLKPGINNTEVGKNAYLCFVSANNYVYPTVGKELGPLTGEITKN